MNSSSVHYLELAPQEFRARLKHRPIGYLPLGTLEWHGEYSPLGTDAIIAQGLFEHAARELGGIVFPPLFLGPDRIRTEPDGSALIGMEYDASTVPARPLDGNCYWVSEGFFLQLCEAVLTQARRAGFKCMVADGHGPSRRAWGRACASWENQFGLKLLSIDRDIPVGWRCQTDHAGENETSLVAALRPDLVHLDRLPADRGQKPPGMIGNDPRNATAHHGQECLESSLQLLREKLIEFGF